MSGNNNNNNKKKNVVQYEDLRGIVQYAFVHRPDSGNEEEKIAPAYKLDLMLVDPKELKKAEALGYNIKPANDKHPHPYVICKSKVAEGRDPPKVLDSQRNPIPPTILIGNGSEVIVRTLPYGYGKGKVSAILKETMVLNLVKYVPTTEELDRKGFLPPVEGGFVVGGETAA